MGVITSKESATLPLVKELLQQILDFEDHWKIQKDQGYGKCIMISKEKPIIHEYIFFFHLHSLIKQNSKTSHSVGSC